MDPKLNETLNDFNTFLEWIGKKNKPQAYQLLKQINLSIVERYYQDNPTPNRPPELFQLIAMLQESFEIEDKYREQLQSTLAPAGKKRCRYCAGMNDANATVCEKCGNPI